MHSELFKIKHLYQIKPIGGESERLTIIDMVKHSEKAGKIMAFSLIHENEIIAIAGIYELWPGVGEAFTIMSKNIRKFGKSLFSACYRNLQVGIRIGNFKRIQAMVKADFDIAVRFAEKFGFEREGLMRKWAPDGSDYYIYARVF